MRNFKQIRRRGLPLLLALVMCLSLVQVPAFAEEGAVPSDYPEILQETAGEPGSSENSESQKQPEMPEISDSTENTGTPAAPEDPEAPAAPAVPENPEGPDAAGTGEETSEEGTEGNDLSDTEDILPEEVQAFLDAVNALWDQADSDDAEAMLAAVEEAEELYGVLTGEQKELPQVQQCRAALDAFWETVTLEDNEGTTVSTLEDLAAAVAEGGVVKLGEDITGNITIAEDRNVTLDLNGHNLYYGNESGYDYHTIIVKGTLILKDSQGGGGLVRMEGDNRIQRRVKVEETGNFTLESGTISGAFGTAFGAIWVAGGKLTMTGGKIVNNSGTSGGGVYLNSNGTFIMTGGEIVDNSSIDGGGVYLTGDGTFIMDNGTITGNTAKDYGGGVCLIWDGKGSITINGGTISNNGAGQLGGGIASYRPVTINGGNILNNSASNLGGGIFSWSNIAIHGGVISGNGKKRTINGKNFSLTRFGGGINTSDAPVLTITDGEISDNEAEYGGGICMGECSLGWPHPRECDESDPGNIIRMTGGKIINNKATLGGGVKADRCWVRPVKFYFEGGEISGNEADKGGGVYVDPGSLLEMSSNDSRIAKNRANMGGGVYVEGITAKNSLVHGIFRLKAGHITGNEATDGGGVYASPNANIIINQEGNISSNKATGDGGGVYIASKEIDVIEFDLTDPGKYEETKKEVGSQLVAATMNMSGGTISDNTASNGGGVYNSGTFTMSGGTMASNTASNAGGGVWVDTNAVLTMDDGQITENAANWGGGIAIIYGTFNMNGGAISKNTANTNGIGYGGGVLVYETSYMTMTKGEITDNTAKYGGGVFVSCHSDFKMSGDKLCNNQATLAGDDIVKHYDGSCWGENSGTMSLCSTGSDWTLKSTGAPITGWFFDGMERHESEYANAEKSTVPSEIQANGCWPNHNTTRWSANGYYEKYTPVADDNQMMGLKAAHGKLLILTYDANQGTGAPDSTFGEVNGTTAKVIVSTQQPTREGYIFTGWNTQADGSGTAYTGGSSITLAEDVTLYAQWTPAPVTVTWNDGYTDTPVKVKDDHQKGAPVASSDYPANPTRPGYTFTGWGAPVLDEDGNITITAQWRRNNNGGTADLPDPTPTPRPTIPDTPTPLDPGTGIDDQEVPLAGAVGLNDTDHFAYVIGYPDDTVHPLGNITRAEAATIFFRLMTEDFRTANWAETNSFTDVKASDWYNRAVSTCARAGALKGRSSGAFDPNASITRAEFAAIAARFLDESFTDDGTGDFADTANHWAAKEIRLAAKAGWITGKSGNTFAPDEKITRAEVMTIVNRMLDRTPDKDHMLPEMKKWIDNPEEAWYYEAVQEATNEHDYTRDEASVETWTALKEGTDWAALELGWAANGGASASGTEPETQGLPDGI